MYIKTSKCIDKQEFSHSVQLISMRKTTDTKKPYLNLNNKNKTEVLLVS